MAIKQLAVISTALAVLGLSGGVTGCTSTARERVETAAAAILLPPEDEKKLGAQVHDEVSRQVRYATDPVVTGYVHDMAARIEETAQKDNPDLGIQEYVIDDPGTVNAFATPGQRLYVFTGLLLAAESDAQVVGVLAHEAGHIVARHSARQMVDAFGLQTLAAVILGRDPSLIERLGANVATKGFLLANSRADETSADEYGARYTSAAGFDPNALAEFLAAISKHGEEPSGFMAWLSDHPTTPDRVSHLERYIAEHELRGSVEGDRLRQVKAQLREGADRKPR